MCSSISSYRPEALFTDTQYDINTIEKIDQNENRDIVSLLRC